ncbi:MAG: squalene/phytoene synthase family protein [Rickettsiales bacterium]|nr:squalene/phytoene synthase family protein [Rickettsiales bacterium]
MDDLQDLIKLLKKADSEIFHIISQEEKDVAVALFVLNYEIAKIFASNNEKEIAKLRLSWWQEQIEAIFSNDIKTETPLLRLLVAIKEKYKLNFADFKVILEAQSFNLNEDKFKNESELKKFVEKTFFQNLLIIIKAKNIALTRDAKVMLKKYSYMLKLTRIVNSLASKNYNIHPFITEDLIKSLASEKAYKRNEMVILKLKDKLKSLLKECKYYNTESKFLNDFQLLVQFQSKNSVKYADSRSEIVFSPLGFKLFKFLNLFKLNR